MKAKIYTNSYFKESQIMKHKCIDTYYINRIKCVSRCINNLALKDNWRIDES